MCELHCARNVIAKKTEHARNKSSEWRNWSLRQRSTRTLDWQQGEDARNSMHCIIPVRNLWKNLPLLQKLHDHTVAEPKADTGYLVASTRFRRQQEQCA